MTNELIETLKTDKAISDIKPYTLINNYGVTFTKNGKKYDIRRWANLYGANMGWGITHVGGGSTVWNLTFSDVCKIALMM